MVIHANGGVIDVNIEPDSVNLTLADTGPGIPDIERAMKEGYSTASEEARDLGFGAGMGLPNIKKNSDFLNIVSEVGKGTTVEIVVKL
jgi:anti-sigma regulatory factor (Ser/Thr protein kinase)